jgi:hypothetical protein
MRATRPVDAIVLDFKLPFLIYAVELKPSNLLLLLLFGAESFVFQVAIQKLKDQDI